MRLREFFDRTYVINLPERTDRRRAITRELADFEMPLSPGAVEIFGAIRPTATDGFPTVGALGAFLSHMGVIRRARDLRLSNVLVLEDDLALSPRLRRIEDDLVEQLKRTEWGLVFLGYFPYQRRSSADYCGESEPEAPVVLRKLGEPPLLGAHFYAVNGPFVGRLVDFLERLLEERRKGPPPGVNDDPPALDGAYPDCALQLFRMQNPDVVTLIACPSLGWQRSSRSDITTGRLDRVRWLGPVLRLVRPLKTHMRRIFE